MKRCVEFRDGGVVLLWHCTRTDNRNSLDWEHNVAFTEAHTFPLISIPNDLAGFYLFALEKFRTANWTNQFVIIKQTFLLVIILQFILYIEYTTKHLSEIFIVNNLSVAIKESLIVQLYLFYKVFTVPSLRSASTLKKKKKKSWSHCHIFTHSVCLETLEWFPVCTLCTFFGALSLISHTWMLLYRSR